MCRIDLHFLMRHVIVVVVLVHLVHTFGMPTHCVIAGVHFFPATLVQCSKSSPTRSTSKPSPHKPCNTSNRMRVNFRPPHSWPDSYAPESREMVKLLRSYFSRTSFFSIFFSRHVIPNTAETGGLSADGDGGIFQVVCGDAGLLCRDDKRGRNSGGKRRDKGVLRAFPRSTRRSDVRTADRVGGKFQSFSLQNE